MDLSPLGVRAAAGTLRMSEGVVLQHAWTDERVSAAPVMNGGHVLHLAVAMCVLNDTYREAKDMGIEVDGISVEVDGGFDQSWRSTGITYSVRLDSRAPAPELRRLARVVDEVAEIPKAIRAGASVTRLEVI